MWGDVFKCFGENFYIWEWLFFDCGLEMVCPKCGSELFDLEEDILGNTDDVEDELNVREYTCPYCNASLKVYIKIDMIEEK